jgi:hypothetical protein
MGKFEKFSNLSNAVEIADSGRRVPRVFVRFDRLLQDWHIFAQRLGQIASA